MRKLYVVGTLFCASLATSVATAQEPEKEKQPAPTQYPTPREQPTPTPTPEEQTTIPKPADKMAQPGTETAQPTTEAEMKPVKPGAETHALQPIAIDARWVGTIVANAFKEGSPEMATKGNMDCTWAAGNLWLTCKLKSTMGKGKEAVNWQGVFTVGYDYLNKEYRATVVDNMGGSSLMNGTVDGNKLTLTSMTTTKINGEDCRGRLSFDWTDPKAIKFTSEHAKGAEDFKVVEEATLRPTKKERLPGPAVS